MMAPNVNTSKSEFKGIEKQTIGKLRIIRFNVPKRKNALTPAMYMGWLKFLKEAVDDPLISMVAVTGTGDFFSSGNDFGFEMTSLGESSESEENPVVKKVKLVQSVVDSIIDFPKPLVAVVNGPAVGIAATILGLMDAVYCTEKTWLHTPFTRLGLCPEGCSSYTFPRIMGPIKSNEMLLFSKRITADEALKAGLVTEVFPVSTFDSTVWPKIKQLSELPPQSLKHGKQLCRERERAILHQVNAEESNRLIQLIDSEETMEALMRWFAPKESKL